MRTQLLGRKAAPLLVLGPHPFRRVLAAVHRLEPMSFCYVDTANITASCTQVLALKNPAVARVETLTWAAHIWCRYALRVADVMASQPLFSRVAGFDPDSSLAEVARPSCTGEAKICTVAPFAPHTDRSLPLPRLQISILLRL